MQIIRKMESQVLEILDSLQIYTIYDPLYLIQFSPSLFINNRPFFDFTFETSQLISQFLRKLMWANGQASFYRWFSLRHRRKISPVILGLFEKGQLTSRNTKFSWKNFTLHFYLDKSILPLRNSFDISKNDPLYSIHFCTILMWNSTDFSVGRKPKRFGFMYFFNK